MAKRRRSTGSHKRVSGSTWKRSTPLAVVLGLAILGVWFSIYRANCSNTATGVQLKDFPYTFMVNEAGAEPFVKRFDSDKQPTIPFKQEGTGKWAWEAYVCTNPDCPYLRAKSSKAKKDAGKDPRFIFPFVIQSRLKAAEEGTLDQTPSEGGPPPEAYMMEEFPQCPACLKYKAENPSVERYHTEEGKKKLDELRKKYEQMYKDNK